MTAPGWYLDEFAHAGPEHLDDAYVATYDQKAGVDWSAELAELRGLGLDATSTLVDLGAGTGGLALAAAPRCRRVVAVDVSPAMLAVLRDRAARAGLRNLECVHAGLLTYAHTGALADFVYSRHALHHLPDLWKAIALARVASMLRPGGVLRLRDLIYSCELGAAVPTIEAWLAGASTQPGIGWTRAELETHLREEHSTFSWLLEPMLERAGFAIRRVEYSDSRIFADYVCVKPA
jgi:ubiquinone/menaquinone biosynthesis C-methylase UbiE